MKRICCFALALALPLDALSAQEAPTVAPGTRVRVWAPQLPNGRQAGTLVELRGDTLFLQAEPQADTLGIPRASLTRLEISRRQRLHTGEGALLGFTIGAGPVRWWGL